MSSPFVPYQIDFAAIAAGKRVSSTKRKIRWRFGYASQQALSNGQTGTECRGEEHDVTIVWSITSGKRQISMDGREVLYATNRASVLEFNWQTKGNHVIKVVCHAAPPMTAQPGFRQYDLSIDGQSFFNMPKVFQLGVKGAVSSTMPGAYQNTYESSGPRHASNFRGDAPLTREEEDADLRRAIRASINESQHHLGERSNGTGNPNVGAPSENVDLMGFAAPPSQPPAAMPPPSDSRSVASYYSAPTTYGQAFQSPPPPMYNTPGPPSNPGAIVPAVAPPGYYQAPPAAAAPPQTYANRAQVPPAYTSPPPPQYPPPQQHAFSSPPPVPPAPAPTPAGQPADVFGLHSAPAEDPFAPKPPPPVTHQDLTNAILASYQSPSPTAATPQTPVGQNVSAPPPHNAGVPNSPNAPNGNNGGVTLTMNQLSLTAEEEKPKTEFERALQNLVNVDHIDEAAQGEIKLTMMTKEQEQKVMKGKSVPKPPAGAGIVSSNAPLLQIGRDFKSQANKTSDGIMNAPPPGVFSPNAAQAGALVVHGQGPPPLQQAQGFGVGQMLPNGGFQKQQNLAPGYMQQQQKLY
mmetsp:Transcript_11107/g.26682  ORF Transcript_11107/g.26682 Transcript_11107/m.26682 type:complete len:576 (-) Transcript_11107:202-1929(-)|eukprot:CAMPEP_0197182050 /NCGR_PEP_ID=MMETSP1423-20130617/6146_1 /TAXON_ID=476441 /ORGANISM="Pseudo-nitzschia heimii, Strain UNC1101" /LENGTH=575 /DNA_ID=CAMNT_0042632419 /DNA_START=201 /DNA_END=1928 /DNA_ORIENTATION=-